MDLCQGVSLHVIPSEKFKDIGIYVRFIQPLCEETATVYSLLALMMSDRLQKYPSKQAMSSYLDQLYGMGIGAQTIGYGQSQVLELRARMIHPRFADSQHFLEDGIQFLKEMIFHPLLNEECLEEAKRVLLAKIKRMRDDASQFVVSQGLRLAGKGYPLGISALGEEQLVNAITLQQVEEAHLHLLKESGVDIIVCGDLEECDIDHFIASQFTFSPREDHNKTFYAIATPDPYKEIREERNIPQSSVMDVYFTHTSVKDENYYALRVLNAMLGQYSTSLLFQNVREKNSLCYSIYSSLISFDGALGIMTGTNKQDVDHVLALIEEQIRCLQEGTFDDDLLSVSKTMIINSLRAGDDNMNSLATLQYQNDLLERDYTNATIINEVTRVTREDVITMANRLEHKATYIVLNKEAEDEEN